MYLTITVNIFVCFTTLYHNLTIILQYFYHSDAGGFHNFLHHSLYNILTTFNRILATFPLGGKGVVVLQLFLPLLNHIFYHLPIFYIGSSSFQFFTTLQQLCAASNPRFYHFLPLSRLQVSGKKYG